MQAEIHMKMWTKMQREIQKDRNAVSQKCWQREIQTKIMQTEMQTGL